MSQILADQHVMKYALNDFSEPANKTIKTMVFCCDRFKKLDFMKEFQIIFAIIVIFKINRQEFSIGVVTPRSVLLWPMKTEGPNCHNTTYEVSSMHTKIYQLAYSRTTI